MLFHHFTSRFGRIKAGFAAFSAAVLLLAALPAEAEEVTLDHNGMTLKGTVTLADGKTMADGMLLILHGTLAHKDMEITTMLRNLMAERDISSLTISLSLGQSNREGMYDCAVPHTHTNEDAIEEVGLWVDWLKAQGAGDIWIAGHSRGAAQVARYIAGSPDAAVKGAALIAPGRSSPEGAAESFKRAKNAELAPVLAKAKKMVADGKGMDMMKGIGVLYCPESDVSARSFVSYYDPDVNDNADKLIDKFKTPVLVVAGSEDTVTRGLDKVFAPLADGEKIRFVNVQGAGHFFRDLFGEDVADAIQELVEG